MTRRFTLQFKRCFFHLKLGHLKVCKLKNIPHTQGETRVNWVQKTREILIKVEGTFGWPSLISHYQKSQEGLPTVKDLQPLNLGQSSTLTCCATRDSSHYQKSQNSCHSPAFKNRDSEKKLPCLNLNQSSNMLFAILYNSYYK